MRQLIILNGVRKIMITTMYFSIFMIIRRLLGKFSLLFSTLIFKIKCILLRCSYDKNIKISGKVIINVKKENSIIIGENVSITSRFQSNLVGITNVSVLNCYINGKIIIGDNSGLTSIVISSKKLVKIGNNVISGGNVRIFDHDFHSLNFFDRRNYIEDRQNIKVSPVIISDDVFIGTNSIILKGVKIGERSIIGAGSVVTKSVPCDEIWAGNPAKFIKKIETPA